MQNQPITLTAEKETLLITLYGKAMESQSEVPVLNDPFAAQVMQRIDYDFDRLLVPKSAQFMTVLRAKQFDDLTQAFLAKHPTATVVHLGCGLDSRAFRINAGSSVRWIDVDYPDVIALRQELYPERDHYQMIGASVTEQGWIEQIPADRPTFIVAEGLMMYLSNEEIINLLTRLIHHFPNGEVAFDLHNRIGYRISQRDRSIKATGAAIRSSVDDPRDLETWVPGMKFVSWWAYADSPAIKRLPFAQRFPFQFFGLFPAMRQAHRVLLYKF